MNHDDRTNRETIPTVVLCGKSPIAYIRPAIGYVLALLLLVPIAFYISKLIGVIALIACVGGAVLKYMTIKSYQLFYDSKGVWISFGVLPWSKGYQGVKWRDLDEAVFFSGLTSWAFKSYSILLKHRFTQSSEISLTHMAAGDTAISAINELHHELIRLDMLK
jgi:hypothetical protein